MMKSKSIVSRVFKCNIKTNIKCYKKLLKTKLDILQLVIKKKKY